MTRSLRLVGLLVGGAAAAGVLVCSAAGAGAAEGSLATGTRYYMALGGSLTVNGGGAANGQAYDNDLGAYYGATIPNLQTVSFGCPGETTTTFISGKGNCSYPPQGSQLAAAETFLQAHVGQVSLITIDLGGDDLLGGLPNEISTVQANLATIGAALRAAAGPSVPIAGMTFYNPELVQWLNGASGQQQALDSVPLFDRLNAALSATYAGFGASVADVAGAFSSDDFTDLVSTPYGTVPKAVAVACAWLNAVCQAGSGVVALHPNATGHVQIADAFEAVLGPLTPTPTGIYTPTPAQIYGQDAIDTALRVSEAEFPADQSAQSVVLARSDFFADALAGGPLAAHEGGPLLVTPGASLSSTLDPRVLAQIQRVLVPGGTVFILGGDLALSPSIDTALEGLGYQVVREAGADEYATAVLIAQQLGNPTTIFEATGTGFQDALSAVPAAIATSGAILLTDGPVEPLVTGLYLLSHPGDTRYAIGGPLAAAGADPGATAVYGQDIFGTSAAVATKFFPGSKTYGAATAVNFPDALAGGVFMATGGRSGPVLLVNPSAPLPSSISSYLGTLAAGATGDVFGGPLAVGPDVLAALRSAVG